MRIVILFLLGFLATPFCHGQILLGDVADSTTLAGRQIKLLKEYENLSFTGYIQPQFQFATEKGARSFYQGGEFAANANNRFRLRRGRLRADYLHNHSNGLPATYFVFQFDGTEQGVNIRDFWGRYYENKWNVFAFTAGMMVRPFGYELQLSSSARESAERGRMSQILMRTERDLGFMISLHPRLSRSWTKNFQADIGIFNGQGLTGPGEFDNRKDIVARLGLKPQKFKNLTLSAGVSVLNGGLVSEMPVVLKQMQTAGKWAVTRDSSAANVGKAMQRNYYGADVELATTGNLVSTIRAEIILGKQTGTQKTSVTPGSYPLEGNAKLPYFTRPFNGAYFYFIRDVVSSKNKLIAKYDWYDPNSKISGLDVADGAGFTEADIKYSTLGLGYLRDINSHLKLLFWYDRIANEKTMIKGFERDADDDVFTLRAQFMF